jgi:hypothetical protein
MPYLSACWASRGQAEASVLSLLRCRVSQPGSYWVGRLTKARLRLGFASRRCAFFSLEMAGAMRIDIAFEIGFRRSLSVSRRR